MIGGKGLTRYDHFFRFRLNYGTVVHQQAVALSCDELETQVRVVAHFQRWVPGPAVSSEAACGLLTPWARVASGTVAPEQKN
jgi:hypothetical protein